MKQPPFISYEFAKLLKEKGYPQNIGSSFGAWDETENGIFLHIQAYPVNLIKAPLYQQVVDWFREQRHIHIEIRTMAGSNIHGIRTKGKEIIYHYWIHDLREKFWSEGETVSGEYFDYYKALDAAIRKAIELL